MGQTHPIKPTTLAALGVILFNNPLCRLFLPLPLLPSEVLETPGLCFSQQMENLWAVELCANFSGNHLPETKNGRAEIC
jgi:hypothetical protein